MNTSFSSLTRRVTVFPRLRVGLPFFLAYASGYQKRATSNVRADYFVPAIFSLAKNRAKSNRGDSFCLGW